MLLRYYMTTPLLVTLAAAVIGNVLGYTFVKNWNVSMYYNSYSLPTYATVWNAEAFWKTTLVPLLLMAVINALVLWTKLSLPVRFL